LIQTEGLSKSYGAGESRVDVLRDLNFSVSRGETTAVVGVSGVGKSTLLHILGTIDRPTSGRVLVDGQDPFVLKPDDLARFRNRTIGFVFQFHHLLPEFTALENVMMPALIRRLSRHEARDRAAKLLSEVGVAHRLSNRVGQLSGGEAQRVAIARALVLDPPILLADEPTGNLDPRTGSTIQELLVQLNLEKNLTVLVVTHNEKMAQAMGRQLHLVDGKLSP
jgi:lipoprotein-releasing system ATP-binding protein